MRLKLAALIADDGKTWIEANPFRGSCPLSRDRESANIHFGLDKTVDVAGGLDAFETAPSGV